MISKKRATHQFYKGDRLFIEPVFQIEFAPEEWAKLQPGATDCYGYALGLPFVGANSLGSLMSSFEHHADPRDLTPEKVAHMLKIDGLYKLDSLPRDDSHVIAVFYGKTAAMGQPGIHCYCRNANGLWSHLHREGDCNSADAAPAQTDFSGNSITDPLTSDRGKYTDFLGYYAIPYEGIVVRPKIQYSTAAFLRCERSPCALSPIRTFPSVPVPGNKAI